MNKIKLKFIFKLVSGMILDTLVLHTKIINRDELDKFRKEDDNNIIEGEAEFKSGADKYIITFVGSAEATAINAKGSYNFIYKGKKLFDEDQEFKVKKNGTFGDQLENIKLPKL